MRSVLTGVGKFLAEDLSWRSWRSYSGCSRLPGLRPKCELRKDVVGKLTEVVAELVQRQYPDYWHSSDSAQNGRQLWKHKKQNIQLGSPCDNVT